ncbi:MAG TPA: tetratricopeptide repeat protein, partial [Burkholderiaceae bacterium]|nr:tetratricopeptide repeat protein [Burkholderiaceae bacterium]
SPEAEKFAAGWIKEHPKDVAFRMYLGDLASARKNFAQAAVHYQAAQALQPNNALILNNLAWAANEAKDPKALEYAEQALRLAPDNPAIIDTVGTIQVASGAVDAGLANLRRAVSIGPDLLPLQLNLVKALAKAGRKDEARSQLDALMPRLQEGTPMHQEARALQASL